MELGIPDIIAHPDIYMLARDTFGETEHKVANIICKAAEEYNIPLEINLSDPARYVIGKRKKVVYPCKEFWEIASKYNVRVLYGIDAHYKFQIQNYEESVNVANKIIGEEIINKLHFCGEF